ncbi:YncE family protein [Mucilaginibacter agri]|uniref:YncE family protein n=1 Tax=Mucilaginibacter agri TaxID=2695265 RepID=A0A965ZDT3_9SPHI|nr:YncE family protein [Mucilaginibacter agri]NCD67836.1 YncE family protein [Mucilaginibacter agri]
MNLNRLILLFAALGCFTNCRAQETGKQLLTLQKEIALPNVKGRIDHIDINLKDQIAYIAALGNNTLEVVDLKNGKVTGSITGLDEPQGVAYIPKHQELLIANGGTGECGFYNALTLKKTGSIKLADDADDVRYDAGEDKIYVGYGSGGIAIIDAASHKQVGDIILPAHPESFQLETKTNKLWVNLPGSGMIGMADLKQLKLTAKWSKLLPRANFPMAYDEAQHRIIVGYRVPAKLIVYDSETGKEIFSGPMVGDVDDLYWDAKSKQVYLSGGGGAVDIFKQVSDSDYKQVGHIKTRNGARTSLLVPELSLLLIAARESGDQKAALLIYKTGTL